MRLIRHLKVTDSMSDATLRIGHRVLVTGTRGPGRAVIWRNRRSGPQRELEIISQYGQHAVLHALRSERAAKEFLEGLDSSQI